MNNDQSVKFDPGFSEHFVQFPHELPEIIDTISHLKQQHQKKFEFQKLEGYIIPIIKKSAAVYQGCILWGCYLAYRYKNENRKIEGNNINNEEITPNYAEEMDFILNIIIKLNKSSNFYLKRDIRLDKKIADIFFDYKEFSTLNNGFSNVFNTNEIKIPVKYQYFDNYTPEKLDKLSEFIYGKINSGKILELLELGCFSE